MSFLFPLYLLGAAAVVIPVLLHLRRRPPQEVVPFSAVMFLETAPVPPVKRRKLEDLLLLALRCLALALLALMFSRPLVSSRDKSASSARAWVVLLDQSASMRRDDIRPQIATQLNEALAAIRESDDVTLVAFDDEPRVIANLDSWRAIPEGQRKAWLREQVVPMQPGWGGTNLGQALVFGAGLLDSEGDGTPQARRVALISDLQDGASLEALGNFAWPQSVSTTLLVIQPRTTDNLSIATAARIVDEEAEAPARGAAPAQGLRVRVTNARGSRVEKFSIAWKDDPAQKIEGSVAAGGSRVLLAPPRDAATDGVLELSGDGIGFDNRVYHARSGSRVVRILFVCDVLSRTDAASPLFFLARALKPGSGIEPVIVEKTPRELVARDLDAAELVVLASRMPEPMIAPLRSWLEKGRTMLWSIEAGDDGSLLAKLAGGSGIACTEAAGGYAMLGEMHFEHPLLKPFAESGVRDFSRIRFWKHRVIQAPENAGVLQVALFDDRSPAIFEKAVGSGRVVALASGWTSSESQFAVSSKFVPLLYSLLEYAQLASSVEAGFLVGDAVPLEPSERIASLPVLRADGRREVWDGGAHAAFTATTEPGIYTLGEGAAARRVAVNVAPSEGRIAPMDPSRLRDAGVRLTDTTSGVSSGPAADSTIALEDSRLEQRQKLWKIVAATALVILLLETLVAGLRRRTTAEPSAA